MTSNIKKSKPESKTLSSFLTDSKIKKLAGDKYYERGVGYFETGQVENLVDFANRISAHVWGNYKYDVLFWVEHNSFYYSCDCPIGNRGEFCKHCVATALEWIDLHKPRSKKKSDLDDDISFEQMHTYLMYQDKEKLARIIIDQARLNSCLSRRLKLESSVVINNKVDIDFFKSEIINALRIHEYSEGFNETKYIDDLHDIVNLLEELLSDHETEIKELVNYMMQESEDMELHCHIINLPFEELRDRLFDISY
jgi:uncharacterized Zn finger protein